MMKVTKGICENVVLMRLCRVDKSEEELVRKKAMLQGIYTVGPFEICHSSVDDSLFKYQGVPILNLEPIQKSVLQTQT